MHSSRAQSFALQVAAAGAPLLLVYLGRSFLASPAPAPALTSQDAPMITFTAGPSNAPLSPDQQKAVEWVAAFPAKYDLVSPLSHPIADATPEVAPAPVPDEPPKPIAPKFNPIEGLKLTAVLGNDDDRLAAINGKIYRIGEKVRKGLKLTAIDARNARITLTGDDGAMYQIKREIK